MHLPQLSTLLTLSSPVLFRPMGVHAQDNTYNDGQWHDNTPTTYVPQPQTTWTPAPQPQTTWAPAPQPAQTWGWYQPTSYTTYYQTQAGYIVTITSTIPCAPSTTVVYDTTDCYNCCYDQNCCRNQFGGTCWYPSGQGVVTQTVYNNNDNNNQQQAQAVQNNGPRAVARLPTRVMASVGLGMFAVVGGMVWL